MTDSMNLWARFDQLWSDVHERASTDPGMASYWGAIYDSMRETVPKEQRLVGQERFDAEILNDE